MEETKVGEDGEGVDGRSRTADYSTAAEVGRVRDILRPGDILVHVRAHQQRVPRVHRSDQRNPTFRSSLFQYRLPKCILYRFILKKMNFPPFFQTFILRPKTTWQPPGSTRGPPGTT